MTKGKSWSVSSVHDPVPSSSRLRMTSVPCFYLAQDLCIYCSLLPSC